MLQIYDFRKGLNLFEFKNIFDLNLNFELKFKISEKKIQKPFYFPSAAQTDFGPFSFAARLFALFIFPGFSLCPTHLAPGLFGLSRPTGPSARHLLPPTASSAAAAAPLSSAQRRTI
jgi:hypothetical protein